MKNLKSGDKIAIIAPASYIKKDFELIDQAIDVLQSWGLVIKYVTDFNRKYGNYLAGNDEVRAQELQTVLTDSDISAVFCARGGYGCLRLLNKLDKSKFNEKILIGFSDITSLHLYLSDSNITCIHGPTIVSKNFVGDNLEAKTNRDNLHNILFNNKLSTENQAFNNECNIQLIKSSTQKEIVGKLSGGCFSLLQTAIGTAQLASLENKILLIEEVTEPVYRIDRILTHLKSTGIFASTQAIILGDFYQCAENADEMQDIYNIFKETLSDYDFPIALGLPFGHDKINLSWQYNQIAKLDCTTNIFYW